jgi:transcriptional regulator with PAS, ATPase and Fis domain
VHPHPLSTLHESMLGEAQSLDGMLFNPRFMLSIILVARWMARVCMQNIDNISNNRANLLLYGASGAGKTLLASTIGTYLPTYKYL